MQTKTLKKILKSKNIFPFHHNHPINKQVKKNNTPLFLLYK